MLCWLLLQRVCAVLPEDCKELVKGKFLSEREKKKQSGCHQCQQNKQLKGQPALTVLQAHSSLAELLMARQDCIQQPGLQAGRLKGTKLGALSGNLIPPSTLSEALPSQRAPLTGRAQFALLSRS